MAEKMDYPPGNGRFTFFNRSQTMQTKPILQSTLERAGSFNRLINSMDSVKSAGITLRGKVMKIYNFFDTPKNIPKPSDESSQYPSKLKPTKSFAHDSWNSLNFHGSSSIRLPGTEGRIVLYFTSLRGIRRTFEDCYVVRNIFRGCRVWVDERDVSMDSEYRKELQNVLGEKKLVPLPQVFIGGKYVGGAEVIKCLFEIGELATILEPFPKRKPGYVCDVCGDMRFVPCMNCSGSRKIFDEDEGVLKRCLLCNENGLIRCPDCCY